MTAFITIGAVEFGGASGGSPLRTGSTIYFDGDRLHPGDPTAPQIFAVRDDGDAEALPIRGIYGSLACDDIRDDRSGHS